MIEQLLRSEVQEFIHSHEQDDEKELVLKNKTILGLPSSIIAEQIIARRKAKTKLPLYYSSRNIVYPPGLNLEQSSSEKTGRFKAEILSFLPLHRAMADVTGGFGIDTFFFSKVFQEVHHVEPNASLQQIASHNHAQLNASNIVYHHKTAEDFTHAFRGKLDCIFMDPSRRSEGQKVFRLSDCTPNITDMLPELFGLAEYLLIKTSPLLDIQQGIEDLQGVEKVWVVAVENECKEILFLCHKGTSGEPVIAAVNLTDTPDVFTFIKSDEKKAAVIFSEPLAYLYEPNAAIIKAGAYKLIGQQFSLLKLHSSTHLYTSSNLVENFPGRVFKTIQHVKPNPKALLEIFSEGKANIITRNYPLRVEELKKKTKLKDGGDLYLIGFTGPKEKYLMAAERVK